ncbi:hypothetical protein [Microtetraspora fusca]|uniref:hypothetical protein n=1 Tax=Microtetraspora fusca TaxID=1997 RepID=UPI000829A053|nr:hypothetical protein [Microtetraspora fusca]
MIPVSAAKPWTPVLDVRLALAGPVADALVGLLAGLYPALRAAASIPASAHSGELGRGLIDQWVVDLVRGYAGRR